MDSSSSSSLSRLDLAEPTARSFAASAPTVRIGSRAIAIRRRRRLRKHSPATKVLVRGQNFLRLLSSSSPSLEPRSARRTLRLFAAAETAPPPAAQTNGQADLALLTETRVITRVCRSHCLSSVCACVCVCVCARLCVCVPLRAHCERAAAAARHNAGGCRRKEAN